MVGCLCCRCAQAINSLIMEPPIISFIKITALCLALVIKWAKVLFWRWSKTTCSSICIEDHHLFLYNSMTIQNAQLQAKLYKFCISKSVRSSKRNDEYTDYVRVRRLLLNLFFFFWFHLSKCARTHAKMRFPSFAIVMFLFILYTVSPVLLSKRTCVGSFSVYSFNNKRGIKKKNTQSFYKIIFILGGQF